MKSQAKVWLESAGDELTVVAEIIHRDELTHMVAFHCQQAIDCDCRHYCRRGA